MGKRRAHELSKELGIETKELIVYAEKAGITIRNHMQSIEDEEMEKIIHVIEKIKRDSVQEKRVGRRIIRRRAVRPKILREADAKEAAESAEEAAEIAEEKEKEGPADTVADMPEPEIAETATEKEEKPAEELAAVAAEEPAEEEPGEAETSEAELETEAQKADEPEVATAAEAVAEEKPAVTEGDTAETVPAEAEPKKAKKKKAKQIAKIIKRIDLEDLEPAAAPARQAGRSRPRPGGGRPAPGGRNIPQDQLEMAAPAGDPGRKRSGREKGGYKSEDNRPSKGYRRRQIIDESYFDRRSSRGKRKKGRDNIPTSPPNISTKAVKRTLKLGEDTIVVSDLAKRMGIKANEVILRLMQMGLRVMVNQAIDLDTATLVANEFGYEVENVAFEEEKFLESDVVDPEDQMEDRWPVVTVMGHVDHGKTSILDYIRRAKVAQGEAGGITQHIGAYVVRHKSGNLTFIDTPGHEAFTAMRARGAQVTDIVILVVAADDSVMPQTIEAINHAKAAEVPMVVAVNKIDKPNADPRRVRTDLMQHGLIEEALGGDIIMVNVSAKTGEGIDDLLEMVLLQSEVLELRANPNREQADAVVLEGRLDKGRGAVATILIRHGTLKVGDYFVCGARSSKIKAMINDEGKRVETAGPGEPIEILGFNEVPEAGEIFNTIGDEKQAKAIAENRYRKKRETELAKTSRVSLEELVELVKAGEQKTLSLVIKGDVQGTVEALKESLIKQSTEEIKIDIVHTGVGGITESDVLFASASQAIIIGFNVRAESKAQTLAETEGVEIRNFNVIYDVLEAMQAAILGLMKPTIKEEVLGHVEVRDTFTIPKIGTIAGCYVTDGKVVRNCHVRLYRDNVAIYTGHLGSLRRFKEDVSEVASGYECGVGIENYNDIKVGDTMEMFQDVEIKPELPSAANSGK